MELNSQNSQEFIDTPGILNFDAKFLTKQTQSAETYSSKSAENSIAKKAILKNPPNIADLWEAVQGAYDSEWKHQEFILACFRSGCLYYASQKYARILNTSPTESIALKMQGQIEALASKDRFVKSTESRTPQRSKISSLIAIIGLVIACLGFMSPNFKNLVGVGISIFVMAAGLRYFVSKPM